MTDRQDKRIFVRCSQSMLKKLDRLARRAGVSRSDMVRVLILNKYKNTYAAKKTKAS